MSLNIHLYNCKIGDQQKLGEELQLFQSRMFTKSFIYLENNRGWFHYRKKLRTFQFASRFCSLNKCQNKKQKNNKNKQAKKKAGLFSFMPFYYLQNW